MEELMEPIIQIKNVTKTFIGKDNQVEALKGISLDINKGDIYGIIGMMTAVPITAMLQIVLTKLWYFNSFYKKDGTV